jgi:hypothetical protein
LPGVASCQDQTKCWQQEKNVKKYLPPNEVRKPASGKNAEFVQEQQMRSNEWERDE